MTNIFVLFILFLLFNNPISKIVNSSILDELLFAFVSIVGFLILLKKNKISKITLKVIVLCFIIFSIGLFSTIKFGYQKSFLPVFKDIIMFLKMPLTFAFGYFIFDNIDKNKIIEKMCKIIKILTIIIFIFSILNLFFDIGMDCGVRHGFKTFQFIFSHPTFLVYTLVIFISILFVQKNFSVYILMNIISLIFTFRDKAYMFIILYVGIIIYTKRKDLSWKFMVVSIGSIVGVVILYFISYDKLSTMYLQYGVTTARGALYINGIKLAIGHFPFGTGFATWASSISGEYYSILYKMMNMQYVPGITPTDISYITDTYWPYIYTQFGLVSFFVYIYMLYYIYKSCIKMTINKNKKWGLILIIGYSLIASLFEGFYINDSGVFTIIIIIIIFLEKKKVIK